MGEGQVSRGADTRASKHYDTTMGWCALERGHHALLEPLAQLGDPLSGVGAVAITIDAAEPVAGQTAKEGGVSTGADIKAIWVTRTRGSRSWSTEGFPRA